MNKLKLIFAGTPDFAARHLAALLSSGHEVVAVYTQPDKPAGRGQKLTASPVKGWRWPTICRSINLPPCAMKRRRPNWPLWVPI